MTSFFISDNNKNKKTITIWRNLRQKTRKKKHLWAICWKINWLERFLSGCKFQLKKWCIFIRNHRSSLVILLVKNGQILLKSMKKCKRNQKYWKKANWKIAKKFILWKWMGVKERKRCYKRTTNGKYHRKPINNNY